MIATVGTMQRLRCRCGVVQPETYQRQEFIRMVSAARDDGWEIVKRAGEWVHTCPHCVRARGAGKSGSLL